VTLLACFLDEYLRCHGIASHGTKRGSLCG
jgi:hypothetical protein